VFKKSEDISTEEPYFSNAKGYAEAKKHHQLLFTLFEMKSLEAIIAKVAAKASERTDFSHVKELFKRWSEERDFTFASKEGISPNKLHGHRYKDWEKAKLKLTIYEY